MAVHGKRHKMVSGNIFIDAKGRKRCVLVSFIWAIWKSEGISILFRARKKQKHSADFPIFKLRMSPTFLADNCHSRRLETIKRSISPLLQFDNSIWPPCETMKDIVSSHEPIVRPTRRNFWVMRFGSTHFSSTTGSWCWYDFTEQHLILYHDIHSKFLPSHLTP